MSQGRLLILRASSPSNIRTSTPAIGRPDGNEGHTLRTRNHDCIAGKPSEKLGNNEQAAITMTSDPREERARARLAALLTRGERRLPDPDERARQRAWDRATEQERRRMLKDCGWL